MKVYVIMRGGYDYFDRRGYFAPREVGRYTTALEAWNAYKESAKNDYHYNDSWAETEKPRVTWVDEPNTHKIHGQRFGHYPTAKDRKAARLTELLNEMQSLSILSAEYMALNKRWANLLYHDDESYVEPECTDDWLF